MNCIVNVYNVTKKYGSNIVFENISMSINSGHVTGLLGENGAGKTTLIKMLSDICKSDGGTIAICGELVSSHTHDKVSFMLEAVNLYPWMRVKDAISYFSDMFSDFDKEKAYALCEQFNLNTKEKVRNLSKGNQERVMLMLTFSRNTPLYLLDEPIGGLDPKMKKEVMRIILSNVKKDVAIIISSHLLKDLEDYFDTVYILHSRKIVSISATDIKNQSYPSIEDYYLEVTGND